jgi:poly(3-hydroxybutyrate) depolymerase
MKFPLMLLVATSFSFAQWGGGGGGKSLNDYKKVSVSGREIHVYAPSGLKDNSPLLISCHGMDQDPNYQQSNTHWEAVADTAGFVVVYPRGGTGMSTWDISGDKDTKWMTEIIAQMQKDYKIDTKRVYLSGFSMGGMFTYHSMSKIADKIAAFAPTSGTNVMGASRAQRPVPIIHPHGTNDDVLPYNNVEGFLKNYRDQFHCPSQAEEQKNYPNSENSGATMYTWGPCDEGVYIKHLKLPGRGHSPSKADVSDIWNFVKEWTVDGKIGAAPKIEVPTDRDFVFNGSFSDSLELAGWTLNKNSGDASLNFTEGKAEIAVTKKGSKASDIQMNQNGFHFEKGQGYKLTFDASASATRTLEVDVGKNSGSKSYLDSTVTFDLGSDKKNFEIKFVMRESTDKNGRIVFNAGLATGSVFIDNVVLTKIDSSEVGGTISIANGRLLQSAERTFSVYDAKGSFVCKMKSRLDDVQTKLNSMRLEKGLYVVKDGSYNRVFSVK